MIRQELDKCFMNSEVGEFSKANAVKLKKSNIISKQKWCRVSQISKELRFELALEMLNVDKPFVFFQKIIRL